MGSNCQIIRVANRSGEGKSKEHMLRLPYNGNKRTNPISIYIFKYRVMESEKARLMQVRHFSVMGWEYNQNEERSEGS